MLTLNDYLMMQQMQQQNPPQPGGMPLATLEQHIAQGGAAPSYNQYDTPSPISRGAIEGYKAARAHLGEQKPQSWGNWFGNLANDVAVAGLRGSDAAMPQHLGKSWHTSNEAQAIKEAQMMKDLEYLQEAEKARAMQQERMLSHQEQRRHHQEQERHNRAQESMMAPHYRSIAEEREEKLEEKRQHKAAAEAFYQENGFAGIPLAGMGESRARWAQAKHLQYDKEHTQLEKNYEAAKIIHDAASDPKYKELFGTHKWALITKYGENPTDHTLTQLKKAIPEDMIGKAMEIGAANKTLLFTDMSSLPAKAENQAIQKLMKQANVSGHWPAATAQKTLSHNLEKYKQYLNAYEHINKHWQQGMDVSINPSLVKKINGHFNEEPAPTSSAAAPQGAPQSEDFSNLSKEQIEQLIAQEEARLKRGG